MQIISILKAAIVAIAVSTLTLNAQPIDETFTYQGKLLESGTDANGNYNIRVTLEDQAGTLISGPEEMLSVPVIDGLFSIDLNFGADLYSSDRRYLKIEVFEAGVGYVELSPRTPINATPLAAVAMRSLDNEFTRVGNDLMIGDTDERILMNPDIPFGAFLDSSSMFQLNFDGNASDDGGLEINGSTSTSDPYIGFARKGSREAKIEYDSSLKLWIGLQPLPSLEISLNAVRSAVDFEVDGDVSITGSGVLHNEYGFTNQKMQITPVAFGKTTSTLPDAGTTFGSGNFTVQVVSNGTGSNYYRLSIQGVTYTEEDYSILVIPSNYRYNPSILPGTSGRINIILYETQDPFNGRTGSFTFIVYKNTPAT